MPGGPIDYIRAQLVKSGGSFNQDRLNQLVEIHVGMRPDDPLWVQYVDYLANILQGDLGQSMWYNRPVSDILVDVVPWTVFLMSVALFITFFLGIGFGAMMAYKEGTNLDFASSTVLTALNSIPYYIAALLLLYVLSYQLNLFPTNGRVSNSTTVGFNVEFISSVFYHAALPIASVVITEAGGWAISMRGNSIQILGEDYLRVAELRGLKQHRIAASYVGRNAILPMYTSLMISIGFLFGGSVVLEEIFAYPGVGYYMLQAVNARDYPLMMGAFLVITIAVVIGIFIADLTYGFIDPRIRAGEAE
jgi:peptide/nickel transport system permease protein